MHGMLASTVSGGIAPAWTVAPVALGTPGIGNVLSTTAGTVTGSPAPTQTYQWTRDGVNIGAATAATYTMVAADIGPTIRRVSTATNGVGTPAVSTSNGIAYSETTRVNAANVKNIAAFVAPNVSTVGVSGSAVTSVSDPSPAANNFTQGTAAQRPVYTGALDAAYGNTPIISFADINDNILTGVFAGIAQPFTLYWVGQVSGTAAEVIWADIGGATVAFYSNAGVATAGPGGGAAAIAGGTSLVTPSVVCVVYNGVSTAIYINDHTTNKVTVAAAGGAGAPPSFELGDPVVGMVGKTARCMVITGAESLANRYDMFLLYQYLLGLPIT